MTEGWDSIFNDDYSDYDDDDYDPYDTTGKYGQYGVCSRGINKSNSGWCCMECERDRMKRRNKYNKMKEDWFMNMDCHNYIPGGDKPTWTNKGFFDDDNCFNDFRYTYVESEPDDRPLSLDWKVLGLIPPKTLKEVKRQYHKMAKKLHPDKGGDHNKFIELKNSYNNLVMICSL